MRTTLVLILLLLATGVCLGQTPKSESPQPEANPPAAGTESSPDLAAIRAGSEAFVAAFNKRDAKAIAALWTENGEYMDDSGRRFAGRDAIEKGYAEYFGENPNARLQTVIDSLRLVGPDTAIEDGRAAVEPAAPGATGISNYTVVYAKVKGKWLMASARDRWIEAPASVRSAADLEWLIGTWRRGREWRAIGIRLSLGG